MLTVGLLFKKTLNSCGEHFILHFYKTNINKQLKNNNHLRYDNYVPRFLFLVHFKLTIIYVTMVMFK